MDEGKEKKGTLLHSHINMEALQISTIWGEVFRVTVTSCRARKCRVRCPEVPCALPVVCSVQQEAS